MDNSDSSSNASSPRPTLKLKTDARKPAEPTKAPAQEAPRAKTKLKPGAQWSDEYKQRMQADMDALTRR